MKIIGATELKQTYEMERYLNSKNFEIRNTIPNQKLSSNKLAVVTGKWYKIRKKVLCNFCNLNAVEDEFHFLINCPNYRKFREPTFRYIKRIVLKRIASIATCSY